MKKLTSALAGFLLLASSQVFSAENYQIDIKGMHAFVEFKIKHLGYSWLKGRFNDFDGSFVYDGKNPEKSSVEVTIKTASIDSNHGERDKHLRGSDFLDVKKYPEAKFVSTKVESTGQGKAKIHGNLTLHGVTKAITLDAVEIGGGKDPWGGFRRGFEGKTMLTLSDFNMNYNLGPDAKNVEMLLYVEGIRK